MEIKKFKNLDELVSKKDEYLGKEIPKKELSLFDKGYSKSNFSIGSNDVLEFVLYDLSNNVLPQQNYGTVRYIKGGQIAPYLIQSENINDKTLHFGGFLVDTKRLIKEAGFGEGYYRVQLNFLNNRVGSDFPKDRLWIEEISPSRLEIRALPFDNFDETSLIESDIKRDLNQSYDSFVKGKFSADEVYNEIDSLLDLITSADVRDMMSTITTRAGIEQIEKEFGFRNGLEGFYTKTINDFKQSVRNHLLYKNSTLGDANYGRQIVATQRSLVSFQNYNYYTKEDILNLLNRKFKESVEYNLPQRFLTEKVTSNTATLQSLDELNTLVRTQTSTTTFGLPQITREVLQTSRLVTTPSVVTPIEAEEVNTVEVVESDVPPVIRPDATPTPRFRLGLTGRNGTYAEKFNSAWQIPPSQYVGTNLLRNTRSKPFNQLYIRTENGNRVDALQGEGINLYNLSDKKAQQFTFELRGKAKDFLETPTNVTINKRKGNTPGRAYVQFLWKPYMLDRNEPRFTTFTGSLIVRGSLGDTYIIKVEYTREVSRADKWRARGEAKVFFNEVRR